VCILPLLLITAQWDMPHNQMPCVAGVALGPQRKVVVLMFLMSSASCLTSVCLSMLGCPAACTQWST
jgi:hypothetical protein